jgi:uncharacterized protein YacL
MMDKHSETRWNRLDKITRWILIIFCLIIGITVGAGLFETIVITPLWSETAEAARGWTADNKYIAEGGKFFARLAPLRLLSTITLLIAAWFSPQPLKKWLLVTAGIILALTITTLTYFAPGQSALKGATQAQFSDADLEAKAHLWVVLNWLRQIIALILFGVTLHALGLSYRQEENARSSAT